MIFVGINISAAFRNRNVVSRTCLHRVCLLLNVELEYTLSYSHFIPECWVWAHVNVTVESNDKQTDYHELISHFNLPYLLEDSRIVHYRIVPPCHIVLLSTLSTSAKSTLTTWCRIVHSFIVHSRKFSVPTDIPIVANTGLALAELCWRPVKTTEYNRKFVCKCKGQKERYVT